MNRDLVIYLSLLLAGIVFAIIALFAMMAGPDYFTIIFAAYMLGYSIYLTVVLFRKRAEQKEDEIKAPIWVTLFSICLSLLLAGMAVVMLFQRKKSNSGTNNYFIQPSSSSSSYRAFGGKATAAAAGRV